MNGSADPGRKTKPTIISVVARDATNAFVYVCSCWYLTITAIVMAFPVHTTGINIKLAILMTSAMSSISTEVLEIPDCSLGYAIADVSSERNVKLEVVQSAVLVRDAEYTAEEFGEDGMISN